MTAKEMFENIKGIYWGFNYEIKLIYSDKTIEHYALIWNDINTVFILSYNLFDVNDFSIYDLSHGLYQSGKIAFNNIDLYDKKYKGIKKAHERKIREIKEYTDYLEE